MAMAMAKAKILGPKRAFPHLLFFFSSSSSSSNPQHPQTLPTRLKLYEAIQKKLGVTKFIEERLLSDSLSRRGDTLKPDVGKKEFSLQEFNEILVKVKETEEKQQHQRKVSSIAWFACDILALMQLKKVEEHRLREVRCLVDLMFVISGFMSRQIKEEKRILGFVDSKLSENKKERRQLNICDLDQVKAAFERLKTQGFQPDVGVYNYMILAYVNAGKLRLAEDLISEMAEREIMFSKETFMPLWRSYVECGDANGAQRIAIIMAFSEFQSNLDFALESCTYLIEAFGKAGDPDLARHVFDYMIELGHKPDDRCTASMIAAYEEKNQLDEAANLLSELLIDGFEPGVAACSAFVDLMGKRYLIDEAEQFLDKNAEQGDASPLEFDVHVSLCCMCARAGVKKKTLQALGVLEANKEQLEPKHFEMIILALLDGGFEQDARKFTRKFLGLMELQGVALSDESK